MTFRNWQSLVGVLSDGGHNSIKVELEDLQEVKYHVLEPPSRSLSVEPILAKFVTHVWC
jgi:hypothetical protein